MAKATTPPANGFVAVMRRLYNPIGFSKGYNFVFWFITMGSVLFFFTVQARSALVLTLLATSLASHSPAFNTSPTTASSVTPTIAAPPALRQENATGIFKTRTRSA